MHAPARRSSFLLLLIAVLTVPRIARLLYPQIWIEDDAYLSGAFLLSRGAMPYRDFPLPHLPLLEALLAAVFKIAPISIRTAEVVTALAALAGSVLVFKIGERLGGRAAGTVAALIFATSDLLFRYHVFEREVFDVVPMLAAVWAAFGPPAAGPAVSGPPEGVPDGGRWARAAGIGVLMAIAMAIKLTAVAALAALVLQLAIEKRRREALIVAAVAGGAIAIASACLAAAFGTDFVVQVFAFRAVHASFPSLDVKINEMRLTLGVAFAAGVAGIVFIVWTRCWRAWLPVLLQLASGVVFLVLLNPTYWAHTGIELLPWLALCGGALLGALITAHVAPLRLRRGDTGRRVGPPRGAASRSVRLQADVCVVGAVLLVLYVSPIRNLNWEAGDRSVGGFGYRDRDEIAKIASVVRAQTPEDARVATPPIVAFAANRRELVPYAELAGDIGELTEAVRRDGYLAAINTSPLRSRTFWDGVEASRLRIAPVIDEAVARHGVAAVVNYSADDLFPIQLVDVEQGRLERSGFEIGAITEHYEVWKLK